MKKHLVFLLTIFLIAPQISLANTPNISGGEIIGTVNGENLLLSEYKRLVSSQRKSFHKNLDFDLFSKKIEGLKKREDQLKKAKNEGLSVSHEEFSSAWEDLLKSSNGIDNLEKRGKENKLLLVDIQRKLEDNVLLDKYFDKHIKEKLLQVMVDELIILQEAKARDLQVPEELVIKKLELIEEKQGGEEAFRKFLAENNATIEDAKQEVKNQFLYEFIKEDVAKELHTDNKEKIKNYFRNKREESKVIVYDEKIPGPKITLAKLVNESKVKLKDQDKKEELVIAEAKIPEVEMTASEETKASQYIKKEINDEITSLEEQVVAINKDLQKKKESRDVIRSISASDLLKKKEEVEAANRKKAEIALAKKQEKEAAEAKKAELALAKKQEAEAQETKKAELALAKKQEMEAAEAKKAELALAKKQEAEAHEAKKAELALAKKQEMEAAEAKKAELALAKKQEMEAVEAKKAELTLAKGKELEAAEAKKAELALVKKQEMEAAEAKKAELALAKKQEAEAAKAKKAELALAKKQEAEAAKAKKAELALAKKQEAEALDRKKIELTLTKKQIKEAEELKKAELALVKKQEKEAEQIKKAELALIKKQTEVSTKKENKDEKTLITSFDKLDKRIEEKRKIALKKKIDKYALVKAKEKQKEKLDQFVPGQPIATEPVQIPSQVSTITPVNEETFDISKELQELRKKIEERRVTQSK